MPDRPTATTDSEHFDTELATELADLFALPETPDPRRLPPILTDGQRHGDLFVQPDDFPMPPEALRDALRLADGQDVVLIPDGHQHVLRAVVPAGGRILLWPQHWANVLALLSITGPAYALVLQPTGPQPHPPIGIGAGTYALCRQVEPLVLQRARATTPTRTPAPAQDFRSHHASLFVVD